MQDSLIHLKIDQRLRKNIHGTMGKCLAEANVLKFAIYLSININTWTKILKSNWIAKFLAMSNHGCKTEDPAFKEKSKGNGDHSLKK